MLGQVCPSSRAPQLGTEDSAASTGKLGHPPRPGTRPVQAPDQTSESKIQNSRGTRRGEPVIIHLQWALDILIITGNRTRGRVHIHGTAILPKVHNVISIQQQGATQLQSSGLPSPAPTLTQPGHALRGSHPQYIPERRVQTAPQLAQKYFSWEKCFKFNFRVNLPWKL